MKKYKIVNPLKIKSIGKCMLYKTPKNKEICENYYRVDDKYGNGRGEY